MHIVTFNQIMSIKFMANFERVGKAEACLLRSRETGKYAPSRGCAKGMSSEGRKLGPFNMRFTVLLYVHVRHQDRDTDEVWVRC